jgi:hypothetical protein
MLPDEQFHSPYLNQNKMKGFAVKAEHANLVLQGGKIRKDTSLV